jgi:hypothetical protein
MNIIFEDQIQEVATRYTVLELDTFYYPAVGFSKKSYCVVDNLPIDELRTLEHYKTIHEDLLKYYRQRYWTYCEHAIEGLLGKWNGELDSFYLDLLERVKKYKETPPDETWDGTIVKS